MRRAINTIPHDEYNELLRQAASRIRKKIQRLSDEEVSKMQEADNKGDYVKAEMHDFNARALRCMADMYYQIYKIGKED